ncbi:MAG: L,D-transpeptidase [Vulcanibacillus sp.]
MSVYKVILFLLLIFFFCTPSIIALSFPELHEGIFLEIDKTNNLLHVYLNGYITYSFRVATGVDNTLIPNGIFKIITKVEEPWYLPKNIPGGDNRNPLGTRWLGINIPGSNGYKYGIHGTNNPNSIGQHVSQGCIRMYNWDAEWLFRHIPLGTPIIIK